jgi:gamma-glutamylcyclotransferase (GGCT)/AIG2-like uncharacterized protein YtfP
MYDAGFPVLRPRTAKPADHNAPVWGEVYLVTDPAVMASLDRLESEGRMYHRHIKKIMLENGRVIKAHTYVGDARYWRDRVPLWPLINGHQGLCYHWERNYL